MGNKISKEAMKTVKRVRRYTKNDSRQQEQSASSRQHHSARYRSSRSARSPSRPPRPARRTHQSTGTSAELSPQAIPQPQVHRDIQAPQRREGLRLDHTPRERRYVITLLPSTDGSETTSSQSESEIEPPGRSTGLHDGEESSATGSQDATDHRDYRATEKRTRKNRFGEEFKPSGLFTESDLEERRRRDGGGA